MRMCEETFQGSFFYFVFSMVFHQPGDDGCEVVKYLRRHRSFKMTEKVDSYYEERKGQNT